MSKMSDQELYELGQKIFKTAEGRNKRYGVAVTADGFTDGTYTSFGDRGCHGVYSSGGAQWSYGVRNPTMKTPIVMCNNFLSASLDIKAAPKKTVLRWYDYLFNRSPWSDCYLTKNVEEAFEIGTIVRLDRPANLAITAGISTRHPWERPAVVRDFCSFVDIGLHEDKAILAAFCIAPANKNDWIKRYVSGHTCLYVYNINKQGLKNFLSHRLPPKHDYNKLNYCDIKTYSDIIHMWNPNHDKVYGAYEEHKTTALKFQQQVAAAPRKDPFGVLPVLKKPKTEKTLLEKIEEVFDKGLADEDK